MKAACGTCASADREGPPCGFAFTPRQTASLWTLHPEIGTGDREQERLRNSERPWLTQAHPCHNHLVGRCAAHVARGQDLRAERVVPAERFLNVKVCSRFSPAPISATSLARNISPLSASMRSVRLSALGCTATMKRRWLAR